MIREVIAFVLSNFTLTFLVIGLLFSLVAIARAPKPVSGAVSSASCCFGCTTAWTAPPPDPQRFVIPAGA